MGDFNPIGDVMRIVGDVLSSPLVVYGARAAFVYLVLLYIAAAWWVFADARSRVSLPGLPFIAALLILVATPVGFPFALLLYRIVRPRQTLDEFAEREYTLEALAAEFATRCPECDERLAADWVACPRCGTVVRVSCAGCAKALEIDWRMCPWCGRSRPIEELAPRSPRRGV